MAEKRLTEAMEIATRINRAADDLMWCTRERYTVVNGSVLKGGVELVSLYTRTTADEVAEIANVLEGAITPLRKKRVVELIAKIRSDLDALSQSDF